ncbi:Homeodomain-like protein, partial [Polyporus arcularius HHB13444]
MSRRHIPPEMKQQIVTMSAYMTSGEISRVTDVSDRTVRRILGLWREQGVVVRRPAQAGRPRILNGLDLAYLEGCIERTPDIYLAELQEELEEARGIEVSCETISSAL